MKICIVTPTASEGAGGGITTHLRLTAEGLAGRGHEVTVISGARDGEPPCAPRGARVEIVPGVQGDTFSPEFWRRSAETFRALSAGTRFDVILSEGSSALGIMRLAPGAPIAAFVHQFKAIHLFNSFQEVSTPRLFAIYLLRTVPRVIADALRAELPFFRRANAIICGARHVSRAIGNLYRIDEKRLSLARYWTDAAVFHPGAELREKGRRLLGAGENDFIFLAVGRLQETKGADTALRAFSAAAGELPGARLALVGGGTRELVEKYKRLAEDLGIGDRVAFTGIVPEEDLPALYNAADVVLMPSKLIEAGPYTVLEAMSCGRPVIAARRPGSVEMLGEAGYFHAPGDAAGLAAIMKKLRGAPALRSAAASENLKRSGEMFGKEAGLDCLEMTLRRITAPGTEKAGEKKQAGGAFFRDAAMLFANNLLLLAVSILSGALIARGLGPEGKGLYTIALLFPTLAAVLGSLGLNYSVIYFLNKEPANRPSVAGSSLAYALAAGTLLSMLIAGFSVSLSGLFFKGAGTFFIVAGAPLALLLMVTETLYYFFLATRDIRSISVYTATRNISHLVIVSALFYTASLTVERTLLSQAAALAGALAFAIFILKSRGFFKEMTWDRPVFGRMLSFGLRQHAGTAAQTLNYRIDIFIAAALLTPYQVGLYSISVSMAELLWHIPNAAGQVLYPKISASSKPEADRFTPEVARHVFFITLLASVILWLAAAPLTALLFGREFLPATTALKILLPGVLLLSVSKVIGSDISARGYPQYNSSASVVSLVLAVTLNLLLIPRYGVAGAAAATSASYLANTAVMFYFFLRVSGTKAADMFLPTKKDLDFYTGRIAAILKRR